MRGGRTSPGLAVTALRVSSCRKSGMPAPRSTIWRHCAGSSSPSVSAATSPAASFSLSGSSSMSTTPGAHGASRANRLVIRIMVPGMRWVARSPSRSTVVGSAQWRSSAHTRVGVEAAVCASQVTRAWSVCWRSASASTSGRDHRSSVSSPNSGASRRHGVPSPDRHPPVGPANCGEPLLRRLVRVEAEQLLEHAPDRPQCDVAVIRRALGLEHETAFDAHMGRQLRGQRRLPHAVHAADDDHRLLGTRAGPRRPWTSCFHLKRRRRLWPSRPTRATDSGSPRPDAVTARFDRTTWCSSMGRAIPLSVRVPTGFSSKCGSTRCRVVSLITTVPGSASPSRRAATLGTEPGQGRPVDDPRGQPGDHDGARVDADTDCRLDAVPSLQLDGRVRHPLDEPQPGQHGPPGVVLVRGGVAEARHDAVALELEHAAPQLLDGLRRHPPVQGEDVLNDLRLGHFGHVGRLHDVGEDQADEGALAPRAGSARASPAPAWRRRAGSPDRRRARRRPARPRGPTHRWTPRRPWTPGADRSAATAGLPPMRRAVPGPTSPALPPQSPAGWAWLT